MLLQMQSAMFCIVCSFAMFIVYAIGDHTMEVYSGIGLVIALYVASRLPAFAPLGKREKLEHE